MPIAGPDDITVLPSPPKVNRPLCLLCGLTELPLPLSVKYIVVLKTKKIISLLLVGVGSKNRKPKKTENQTGPRPKKTEPKKNRTETVKPNRTEFDQFGFGF
ncbi:hypothetical protein DVH24_006823 [Malus domestica]|uniref:Uncharacterized protein n=1 Tax=Malus domestica TaxID=3750 RepID=A0A498J5G3_MALDO|nr:hypothetical protein DVH24_006823 [Malus domestica]